MSTYDERMTEWLAMEPEPDCACDLGGDCFEDAEWDGPDDTGLKFECLRIAAGVTSSDQIVVMAREFYEFVTE